LIPIAFGAAAAVFFNRARPGAQASCALVLGVVAFTYGGLAVAEAAGAGLEGHDYTGLLLLPGGLVLFGLAV